MHAAAFFDLDRTVMSGASSFYFGRAALKRHFYTRRQVLRDAWTVFWFRRRGASDDTSTGVRDHILSSVKGHRRADMDPLIPDVLGPVLLRVYPEIYDRILAHERDGVPTYLCSASPVEIVGRVALALKMSGGALATTAEVDEDGAYTGHLEGPFCYGEGKAVAIRAEAQRRGIDLSASWAYSDSGSDLPMMEVVGNPVAVNPDKRLKPVAKERGWEIVRLEPRHGLRLAVGAGAAAALAGGATTGAILLSRRQRRR